MTQALVHGPISSLVFTRSLFSFAKTELALSLHVGSSAFYLEDGFCCLHRRNLVWVVPKMTVLAQLLEMVPSKEGCRSESEIPKPPFLSRDSDLTRSLVSVEASQVAQ